ncbi:MAG TPA: L-threonylcarbamoyladenylate synthase [Chloroflexota bacterium]|jgi:L-threonylcarbamoyladenylate synthase
MQRLPARRPEGLPDAASVAAAVAALSAGDLVILPTDTVYGIAADAGNAEAVARLFRAKNRPPDKAILLLATSTEQAATVADLASPLAQQLAARWWPGAVTLVSRALVPLATGIVSGDTVGVRVPADALVRAVAAQLGRPLAVTSANRSGQEAVATFDAAVREVGDWVALALDGGNCADGVASTIVDVSGGKPVVLRQGSAVI